MKATTFVAVFVLTAASAVAQERLPLEPFGKILSARVQGPAAVSLRTARAESGQARHTVTASGTLVDGKGFFESDFGLTYADKSSASHQWSASLTYANPGSDQPEVSNADQITMATKVLLARVGALSVAAGAAYSDTQGIARSARGVLAGTLSIAHGLSLSANVGAATRHPKAGSSRSAARVGTGLEWDPNDQTAIGVDYVLENRLTGESDYSLSISHSIGKDVSAAFVAGKHGVIALELDLQL